MTSRPIIVWFRQDLRLQDNAALCAAAEAGPIIPVYILDDEAPGPWMMGAASRWWLHHSLEKLQFGLKKYKCPLILRRGRADEILPGMMKETGACAVYWNRCYEPFAIVRDKKIKDSLEATSFQSAVLHEPWDIQTKAGGPYKVYTPFSKACFERGEPPRALAEPEISPADQMPESVSLEALKLLPRLGWADRFSDIWTPGEGGAHDRLNRFLENGLSRYSKGRDFPGEEFVSRLSPYLHFGEISPRQVWHAATRAEHADMAPANEILKFKKEILWREFCYHLLYHFPSLPEDPLNDRFSEFKWNDDPVALKAWQKGLTGVPIVDAGMRQLWQTGWMHNRVRMIVGSFLVKNLLVHWRHGEEWFWDTLLDADLANNAGGWQWIAGCGADAAPYFRVFNPVTQSLKFDPDGVYIRRYVPELKDLPNEALFSPWEATPEVLSAAGVVLGKTYPKPIVDLKVSRTRALERYNDIKAA